MSERRAAPKLASAPSGGSEAASRPSVEGPMRTSFEREQVVRFGHCDPAGIVFFPQYFVMLNELVEDWLASRGQPLPTLVGERGLGLPTVHLACDFTAVSRFGDVLRQRLAVKRAGHSSLTLDVRMHCGDEPRFVASQVLVCTSLRDHRAQPLPADVREALAP